MNDTSEKYLQALIEAIGRTKEDMAVNLFRSAFGETLSSSAADHDIEVEFDGD